MANAAAPAAMPPPMTGSLLAVTSIALALGTFMQVLDTTIANVSLPTIAGTIAWRWIFLINLPVGAICAALCWRNMRTRETPTRKLPIDGTGFALLLVWVGALQVMLDTGKDADWFNSPAIVVEAIVAVI